MLFRLFRLPPIVYFIVAPLLFALGAYLFFVDRGQAAERAAALSHSAPAEVALADITSDNTGNDYNEIVVRAQGDVANAVEVVRTKRGRERGRTVFLPLHPADAEDFSGPALGVLEVDGELSEEALARMYVADGPAGPVFVINGILDGGPNSGAADAFRGDVELADGVRTIQPFLEGREAELSNKGSGFLFVVLGLVLALLVGGYGFMRKRHLDAKQAALEAAYAQG